MSGRPLDPPPEGAPRDRASRELRARDLAVVALVLGTLLAATPLRFLWVGAALPWWSPFVFWPGLVLLGAASAFAGDEGLGGARDE